jgi:hypothetical protein
MGIGLSDRSAEASPGPLSTTAAEVRDSFFVFFVAALFGGGWLR